MLALLDDGDLGRVRRSLFVILFVSAFAYFFSPSYTPHDIGGLVLDNKGVKIESSFIYFLLISLNLYFLARYFLLSNAASKGAVEVQKLREMVTTCERYVSISESTNTKLDDLRKKTIEVRNLFLSWPNRSGPYSQFLKAIENFSPNLTEKQTEILSEIESEINLELQVSSKLLSLEIHRVKIENGKHTYEAKYVELNKFLSSLKLDQLANRAAKNRNDFTDTVKTMAELRSKALGTQSFLTTHLENAHKLAETTIAQAMEWQTSVSSLEAKNFINKTDEAAKKLLGAQPYIDADSSLTSWVAFAAGGLGLLFSACGLFVNLFPTLPV